MIFVVLLLASACALAGSAAFFSIYGLTKLFSASIISIIIMGVSLEFGKLIAASFIYRYWKKVTLLFRVYMFLAVIVLMAITSIGIFGYLTASYQVDSAPITLSLSQVQSDQTELTQLTDRKEQINKQIADLPNNYVTSRQRLMQSFQPELDRINKRSNELRDEITKLKTNQSETSTKLGPIMYVAQVLNVSPDKTVFWFVLLIMSVFDPLAVALTIAANITLKDREQQKENSSVSPAAAKTELEPEVAPIEVKNDDRTKRLLDSIHQDIASKIR